MPQLCLITGIAGFAGSFLAEQLLVHGYKVAGTLLPGESRRNIRHIKYDLSLANLDIRKEKATADLLSTLKPDYVFHLAAFSSVGQSFEKERLTYQVNIDGTLNLLQAARGLRKLKKLVFVSSADVYGIFSPKNQTLTESQSIAPVSPYGISKATGERLCAYYHRQYGLPAVVVRAFNHTGPRQAEAFVVPSFARQVALIDAGRQQPVVRVGNLSAKRDLSDVRDVVTGYRLVAEHGHPGEVYQLCSGRAVAIQTVLNSLLKMSKKKIRVTIDKSRLRKSDIPVLRGSYQKAARDVGYAPGRSLRDTLQDTLDYFREKVSR